MSVPLLLSPAGASLCRKLDTLLIPFIAVACEIAIIIVIIPEIVNNHASVFLKFSASQRSSSAPDNIVSDT